MKSAEKFEAWMRALPWSTTTYAAANQLSTQQYTAEGLGYGPMIVDFLKSIQNPMTGLWGNALDYEALNASLKVSVYFHQNSEQYPNMDKMIDALIYILTTSPNPPQTASETWNPVTLMNNARISYNGKFTSEIKKKIDNNMAMIVKWAVDSLLVFRKSDGGFSYSRQKSTGTSQGAAVSLGLAEGDMNASMLLLNLWEKCHAVAGMPTPRLYNDEDSEYFLSQIAKAKAPIKSEIDPLVYSEDFEKLTNDTILETAWSIRGPQGNASIVQDPDKKEKNNVFRLDALEGATTANQIVMGMSGNKDKLKMITFQMEFYLTDISDGVLYYNYTNTTTKGGAVVQWLFVGSDDQLNVTYRSDASGTGTVVGDTLDTDTWYTLKIEYEPKGAKDSVVRYYIDDELCATTNRYSGFGTREPSNSIDSVLLNSSKGSYSTLYIDNVKLFVE